MQTPLKPNRRSLQIQSVKVNYVIFFNYSVLLGCTLVLGSLLQILLKIDITTVGKDSILTGLPYLRNAFFFCPIIINLGLITWLTIIYNQPEIASSMNDNIWKFFHKVRLGFLLTNLTLLVIFYFIYHFLYVPLWISHEFRLSGHVLACLFSGAILLNIISVCEMFKSENIKKEFMTYTINTCKFLLYHNIYVILWTAWIFHKIRETTFSFFFAFVLVLLLISLNTDRLVVFLMNKEPPKRFKGKEKNKILENYEII